MPAPSNLPPAQSFADPGPVVLVRQCDGCTMCCKVMKIDALAKPAQTWCTHCERGVGCTIYDKRPKECADFICAFLTTPQLSEEWRPETSKIVLAVDSGGRRIVAHVDRGKPDAWRHEPFYSQLKNFARTIPPPHGHVVVAIGLRMIVILPYQDVDIGDVGPDELVYVEAAKTAAGRPLYSACKIHKSDPRASN